MTNQPPRLQMTQSQAYGPYDNMSQIQTVSPPIANSIEEARAMGALRNREPASSLDEAGIEHVRTYLAQEPRASDHGVREYLGKQGYVVGIRDVTLARSILEME